MVVFQLVGAQVVMGTVSPPVARGKHGEIARLVRFLVEVVEMSRDLGEVACSMM